MFWYRPLLATKHIAQLNIDGLLAAGIKGLLIDLDNTLMLPHVVQSADYSTAIVPREISQWLKEASQQGLALICVTNNKDIDYCLHAETLLGIPVIHAAKKPFGDGLKHGLHQLALSPRNVAVVGDRPTTDGWGAFTNGCHYIQTFPLRQDEPCLYRCLRWLEGTMVGRPLTTGYGNPETAPISHDG
jgi:HAD superfamily phosphatase (TIGR01668 family)